MRSQDQDAVGALLPWAAAGGWFLSLALVTAAMAYPTGPDPAAAGWRAGNLLHGGFVIALLSGIFFLFAVVEHYFRSGGNALGFGGFALSVAGFVLLTALEILALLGLPWLPSGPTQGLVSPPGTRWLVSLTGGLLALGFAGFGFQLARTRAFAPIVCSLSASGAVLLGAGLGVPGQGALARAGALLFGLGLAAMSLSLYRRYRR